MDEEYLFEKIMEATTAIVVAQLHASPVRNTDVPALIGDVFEKMKTLTLAPAEPVPTAEVFEPAVSERKSLADPAHILSMIDGKPYTMLKRHLAQHGLTPDQYRERYKLRPDYPMTAKAYSERRRDLAKQFGLGRKPDPTAVAPN